MQAERPEIERGARAVLVALQTGGLSERGLTASLDELARLLDRKSTRLNSSHPK